MKKKEKNTSSNLCREIVHDQWINESTHHDQWLLPFIRLMPNINFKILPPNMESIKYFTFKKITKGHRIYLDKFPPKLKAIYVLQLV